MQVTPQKPVDGRQHPGRRKYTCDHAQECCRSANKNKEKKKEQKVPCGLT